jgi:VanZ family protein
VKRSRVAAILAVAALAAVLAFFALRASPYLQYIPWMPRSVGIWADSHGISRNVVAFFVLGLATFLLVGRGLIAVIALCAFGTAVEVAQIWIPSRAFDPKDIAASVAGILAAWPLAWLVRSRRRTHS